MAGAVSKTSKDNTLDYVLAQLGDFGRYQVLIFVLFAFAVITHSMMHIAFVFTSKNPGYRCNIPQCENSTTESLNEFNPEWLTNAVPYTNEKPAVCLRFQPVNESVNQEGHCESGDFNRDVLYACEDGYVYDTDKISIVNDFDIHCDENTWKLTIVGTINNIGQFVGLPLAGLVSDRFGRRATLVWGMVLGGLSGIIRSFSTNYIMFVIFEFFDAAFSAGTYACGFILGVELVGPSKRVLSGTIISSCYAVGEVAIALLAWWITSWRTLILASYIPALFLITYLWLTPESVRWLLSQGRYDEAKAVLRRVASVNKTTISEDALDKLTLAEETAQRDPLSKLFKSPSLLLRFINCCFCWITCAFLFYGLTLNSVSLAAGNSYIDFILTSLVEIPAYIATCVIVDRLGRRLTQCYSFLITGISSLIFIFADDKNYYLQLFVYLFGKFGATAAFTIIYIITSEVFPTPMRHSMMGVCSMIGRIGSMVSPQMPLLGQIWKPLPLLLFGVLSTIAGFLSLLFPETLNTKLPDTIYEAENIGKQKKDPEQQ